MLFQVSNGVLNLQTGQLEKPNRDYFITKITGANFDSTSKCPTWLTFLEKILPDTEVRKFLQRVLGYAITGRVDEQCLFFYGNGANGKTTMLEVLRRILGPYARHASITTFLKENRTGIRSDIARLKGSRMVTASEVDNGKHLDEAAIKELTGGDPVTSRFLYQEFFVFRPEFKLIISTNYRPRICGVDRGIWRRIYLRPL